RARHRAPRLRRHAHGRALGRAHEHGLDLRAVMTRPQPLAGHAVVRGLLDEWRERERKRVGEPLPQRARQRGRVVEWYALAVERIPHLVDPEPRFAPLGEHRLDFGARGAVPGAHMVAWTVRT